MVFNLNSLLCFVVGVELWAFINWFKYRDIMNAQAVVLNAVGMLACIALIIIRNS